ncbi:Hypothetical protein A7982_08402 [Minicystis rosea]|nr:Hypothetical protein A7982_08402 [Minicystis rosea]
MRVAEYPEPHRKTAQHYHETRLLTESIPPPRRLISLPLPPGDRPRPQRAQKTRLAP